MTSVVYHIFENCGEYEYCYENCDSRADDLFYSATTPNDATNDLAQITMHTPTHNPNPRIQRPGITQRLEVIINDHRTTYIDSQHQDCKQTFIFIVPYPFMPQYVYYPFLNFHS